MNTNGRDEPLATTAPTRILVVEDDADIRQVLCVYLKHSGFEVCSASGGMQAMELIVTSHPHLVVLDLMMRPVDGWAVLRWLRAQHLTPPLPVLVLTALYHLDEQVRGFEEGAVEYITKPMQPALLVERIHAILGLSEEQRSMRRHKNIDEQRSILDRVRSQADDFPPFTIPSRDA